MKKYISKFFRIYDIRLFIELSFPEIHLNKTEAGKLGIDLF
jgi:hypothetical protein